MIENHRRVLHCLIANWIMLGLLATCGALLYTIATIRVEASPFAMATGLLLLTCAVGGHWLFRQHRHRTGICLIAVAQIAILATIGAVTSLPIAALTHGYADAALAQADAAMGLDWHGYLQFALDHPFYRDMLKAGYLMFIPESFAVLIYMAFRGHGERVITYVTASILAICMALAGFCFAPAIGPYVHYGVPHDIVSHLNVGAYDTIRAIEQARGGTMVAHLDALLGLISIPSMHTAGALLISWLSWNERWLRPVVLPLNLVMIAATPVDGSHYFIDIVVGIAAATIALAAAMWFSHQAGAEGGNFLPAPSLTPA